MSHTFRNTYILLLLTLTTLSSCYYDEEGNTAPKIETSRELIHYYVMEPTMLYADILTLSYQLKEYLRQPDQAKRDSVSALYFAHVRFKTAKDPMSGQEYYELLPLRDLERPFLLTVYDADQSEMHADVVLSDAYDLSMHHITLTDTETQEWTLTENSSFIMSMGTAPHHTFMVGPYREDEPRPTFHAVWTDSRDLGLYCQLTGHAELQSTASPKLIISYTIERPISLYFVYDGPFHPIHYYYGLLEVSPMYAPHQVYPSGGILKMTATDELENRSTTYTWDENYYEQ